MKEYRILHLEDSSADADLVKRALQKAGLNFQYFFAETEESFRQGITEFKPNVILCDHALPQFDSVRALEICQQMNLEIAFILVTGSVSEEYAVEMMKKGSDDYLLKANLQRLPQAIKNAFSKREKGRLHKQAEEALKESEKNFRVFTNDSLMPIYFFNADTKKIIYANTAFLQLLGYTREELASLTVYDFIHRSKENIDAVIKEVQHIKQLDIGEREWITKDGILLNMMISISFVNDNNKNTFYVSAQDITYRKKAEEKLIESEFFLRESQKIANIGSYRATFVGSVLSGNWQSSETLDSIFGINKNYERNNAGWLALLHPEDKKEMATYLHSEVIGKKQLFNKEYRIIRIDTKETRWVHEYGEIKSDADGNFIEMLGTIQDNTERKKAEEALLQSETNFRAIFENTNVGFLLLGTDLTIILFNNRCNELAKAAFGEEFQNNVNLLKFLPARRFEIFTAILRKVLLGEAIHYEISYPKNDKSAFWLHISCKPVTNKEGKVVGISLALRDITQRKLSEIKLSDFTHDLIEIKNELEHNEARLKQAQAIAHVGNWELDFENEVSLWSDEACRIYGLSVEENKQSYQSWLSYIHPEDLNFVMKKIKDADAPKQRSSFHHRILRKDKTIRYLYSQSQFEFNAEGEAIGIYGVVQDVTEQKIIEQEILLKNEQLQSLTSHLQCVREEERTTISREIHDELGQQLTALKMEIDWVLHKQNKTEEKLIVKLNEMLQMSDGVINTIRRISSDLRPAIIDDMGLIAALEWKCNDFGEKTGVDCRFISTVKERKFENNFSINAFRILQETLTNVSRHSGAKSVNVSVSENATELFLEITDNGKGIAENAQNGKTLGIIGMKERAALLGGKLIIEGTKNKGARTKLILPFKN